MGSLRNKEHELSVFLDGFVFNFDLLMLTTETWYSASAEVFKRRGYQSFFPNRSKKQGGGVEVLIKAELECEIQTEFSTICEDVECLTLLFGKFLYTVMYRPPKGRIEHFIEYLERLLNYSNSKNIKLILGGDLNIDVLKSCHYK